MDRTADQENNRGSVPIYGAEESSLAAKGSRWVSPTRPASDWVIPDSSPNCCEPVKCTYCQYNLQNAHLEIRANREKFTVSVTKFSCRQNANFILETLTVLCNFVFYIWFDHSTSSWSPRADSCCETFAQLPYSSFRWKPESRKWLIILDTAPVFTGVTRWYDIIAGFL